MDLRHRHHEILHRIVVAADNGLDRLHDPDGGDQRVGRLVRPGSVPAPARDADVEGVDRRHDRARIGLEPARLDVGRVVDAEDLGDPEAVHDPFVHHDLGAAAPFLGRLEDQRDPARKVARLGQVARGAQQHRGVPVMAAGVHDARVLRRIVLARRLGDRQRVHVGAQADGGAAVAPVARIARVAAVDDRDHAGLRDPLVQLVHPELAQALGHEGGGLGQVEPQLGVLVQVAPPRGHVFGVAGDAVEDGHDGLFRRVRVSCGHSVPTGTHCPSGGGACPTRLTKPGG